MFSPTLLTKVSMSFCMDFRSYPPMPLFLFFFKRSDYLTHRCSVFSSPCPDPKLADN